MTQLVDIVNRGLQVIGTRTTVTAAELAGNLSNEAIQANLILTQIRRRLLRMAPWACALKTANLVYITSANGTPENVSVTPTLWAPGLPPPPWAYEYQYPVDCVRACWIIPSSQTGYASGVPITTAVTGGAPSFWQGPPVKFRVQTDAFYGVTAVTISNVGLGYAVGDYVTLASGPNTSPPIGAPLVIQVTSVGASGQITGAVIVNQVAGESNPIGGSYFAIQSNPIMQGSTTGSGFGAMFTITQNVNQTPQRVILCNQEFASLVYCQDVTDPNIMDDAFQEAYAKILGANLAIALTGDKKLANLAVQAANEIIALARVMDANEELTINDVTPDFIRIRGVDFPQNYSGSEIGYDWGSMWPSFG
jgi:hypothetical protein